MPRLQRLAIFRSTFSVGLRLPGGPSPLLPGLPPLRRAPLPRAEESDWAHCSFRCFLVPYPFPSASIIREESRRRLDQPPIDDLVPGMLDCGVVFVAVVEFNRMPELVDQALVDLDQPVLQAEIEHAHLVAW